MPTTDSSSRRHSHVRSRNQYRHEHARRRGHRPCGTGDELSAEVAEVVRVIRESGLPNRTTSMFTEIEGDWDEVMQVVRDATFVLASKGIRTEVVLKADIRPGFTDTMTGKLERMEAQIKKQEEAQ
ncbi:MAG: MTH1187 family thiamine-binding protein [Collinsella sp.]